MIVLLSLFIISLLLPIASSYYFNRLMKLIKVRRAPLLVAGALAIWLGYIFFMLPWIFIGEDIAEIRIVAHFLAFIGLSILLYGVARIYLDWRGVMR